MSKKSISPLSLDFNPLSCGHALIAADHCSQYASVFSNLSNFEANRLVSPSQEYQYFYVQENIGVIPVRGALLHRFNASYASCATGYEYIKNGIDEALTSDVKAIILDMHSGGGVVWGCMELADYIYEAKQKKPIYAVVNAVAYSACYALASNCSEIFCLESGSVGSVGVLVQHQDFSAAMEEWGVKNTFIYAGKHKVDGNPYEPLPDSVKKDIQADVNAHYERFVSVVARGRGISADEVKNTEARTFRAKDALDIKLIDHVMTPEEAFSFIKSSVSSSTNQNGRYLMADSKLSAKAEEPRAQAIDAEVFAVAERERISGIMSCDEAKGKDELSKHLAFKTSMSVAEAKSILAVAEAKQEAAPIKESQGNAFLAAMEKGNPEIGAIDDSGSPKVANRLIAAYSAATGKKLEG